MSSTLLHIGVDEAGRGAVVGPLVMSAVCLDGEMKKILQKKGVKDSKKLSRKKRESLRNLILTTSSQVEIVVRTAQQLNEYMYTQTLNQIEIGCLEELLKRFSSLSTPLHVVVDQFDVREYLIRTSIQKVIPSISEITIAFRADESHIECASASIVAKTERDWILDKIARDLNHSPFSGYPSDPKTKQFLQHHSSEIIVGNWPYVRYHWETIKRIMRKKETEKSLKEFL